MAAAAQQIGTPDIRTRFLCDEPTAALVESPAQLAALSRHPKARFQPGAVLGQRFRILEALGRGGMGEVYKASDLCLEQVVALKLLPLAYAHDAERLGGLLREVCLAREISHANVCRVYDFHDLDGCHCLAMEYVDGENLATRMRRVGRLSLDEALDVARQTSRGLAAAHAKRILHRDIKPENVMLGGNGQVRLMDFGIASTIGGSDAGLPGGSGMLLGTPAYMAPEQLLPDSDTVSAATDVYGLGVLMFELFTGRRPFQARNLPELARLHVEEPPPAPSGLAPGVPSGVEALLLACLAKDPAARPRSAQAVLESLPR